MSAAWPELRHAARRLARQPGLTAVAVLTLGLGIGGATAIFSVADAVILRPLPYKDVDRLVLVWQSNRLKQPFVEISYLEFREWRDQSQAFDELAGLPSVNMGFVLTGREPTRVAAQWVTAGFFSVLGVRPILGRALLADDDRPGAARVAVLSHALWQERFEGDPNVVGRAVTLDGHDHTIVGVMPRGFEYPQGVQMWVPFAPAATWALDNGVVAWMVALGRLKPGVTQEQARTELSLIWARFHRGQFDTDPFAAVLTPLADAIFGPTRPALLVLLGAVEIVLLIACTNVAALLLVKTSERSGEMAVRLTLGASPSRLALGLLAESLLLAALGGILGVLVAFAGTPLLTALAPQDVPRLHDAAVDLRTLGFALLATLVTAILSGLAPALLVRGRSLERTLREGSRGVAPGRGRLRSFLVVSEVALALVLLVGAGLVIRSFIALRQVPLGFEPEGLLSVEVSVPDARYPELVTRASALPGVESAALVSLRPLWGTVGNDYWFVKQGQSDSEAEHENPTVNLESVSAEYFRTMRIAVKQGRVFTDADRGGQPGVVVISESLARRSWPGQDAVGQRLKMPMPETPYDMQWLSVIGVVADARYRELQATRFDLYTSYLQSKDHPRHLVLRTSLDAAALAAPVRQVAHALGDDQPTPEAVTMTRVVSDALGGPRFAARVFGAFALVAVLLAALGLYGLLAYSVSRRTREIGVRMALGAQSLDVWRLVVGEGLALTTAGIAVGLAVAFATTRLLEGLLFGVRPGDPLTFACVLLVLSSVAVVAGLLPARRATRVEPAVALRAL